MELFLIIVILIVLAARWFVVSGRMDDLNYRIELLERTIADLRAERAPTPAPPPLPTPLPKPEPVHVEVPLPPPLPVPPPVFVPPPLEPIAPLVETIVEPPPLQVPEPIPAPAFTARMREKIRGEEWEAVVGGNWLNKLGVLVLVVGIASLIGYAFPYMGAWGRVAIGLGVSFAMLIGGWVLEKRASYRVFSYGLLGGGWAALYFTIYAMQAIPAAKVIDNPIFGSLLLLAVAIGMISHSLKYHSQSVTGLAFFIAFATLGPWITPATTLAVVALIPLAASLLYVAYRFEWSELAVFGIVATYGTCASRGDSGAPIAPTQALFSIYWVLFEAFDVLRAWRRSDRPAERAIMPLNAVAFVGLSYAKWSSAAPHHLYVLAAGIAGVYFLSTVLRTWLRPPSSFPSEADTVDRALAGGYEGPITLTAALSAAAILLKFHGGWASTGLLAEAEVLFVAGLVFAQAYPRRLAAALFATFAGKLLIRDVSTPVTQWAPSAGLSAFLFYVNRALRTTDKAYGYAASAMVALIVGFEVPERHLGVAWFGFAALLFVFGWLWRLVDFRIQSYAIAVLASIAIGIHQADVAAGYTAPSTHPWIALASAAVLLYAAVLSALRSAPDRFSEDERNALRTAASWATSAALMVLVWRVSTTEYLGLGWMALGLALLEIGMRRWPPELRVQSYVVAVIGSIQVLVANIIRVRNNAPLDQGLVIAGAAVIAYLIAARDRSRPEIVNVSSATGTAFLMVALWALLPTIAVGPAWAAVALLLLEAGFLIDLPGVRMQAHAAAVAATTRLFFANFDVIGTTVGISHRLLSVIPVVVCHYFEWSRQREETSRLRSWEPGIARAYLYSAAALVVVLLRFELGRTYTVVGWALFALILIAIGHRWSNPDLRWQSYAIAGLTFFRSWTTDFWSPGGIDTPSARIATGAFVVACFFVSQLLISQKDRWRIYFSMLATVLLTILLFHEVSGGLLTMAWGVEGVALLTVGFPLRDRTLRLSGLALFFVCILKLFVYDLRHLETLYRIVSFIALGLILVSVSWVYTRFRDRVERYL